MLVVVARGGGGHQRATRHACGAQAIHRQRWRRVAGGGGGSGGGERVLCVQGGWWWGRRQAAQYAQRTAPLHRLHPPEVGQLGQQLGRRLALGQRKVEDLQPGVLDARDALARLRHGVPAHGAHALRLHLQRQLRAPHLLARGRHLGVGRDRQLRGQRAVDEEVVAPHLLQVWCSVIGGHRVQQRGLQRLQARQGALRALLAALPRVP
mmetsp:Transcript_21065/g.53543  ORF Transcript_21065/g.53543 Transcript_21065/m.53543 type:complete len:208 (-) Transcript_21065:393-1016(-)